MRWSYSTAIIIAEEALMSELITTGAKEDFNKSGLEDVTPKEYRYNYWHATHAYVIVYKMQDIHGTLVKHH